MLSRALSRPLRPTTTFTTMARDQTSSHHPLRMELIVAAVGLLLGFVVLPALIFFVGNAVIGTYAGGAHRLGSFYGNLFADLTGGSPIAWTLVTGPYVLLLLLRLIFLRRGVEDDIEDEPEPPRERARKEPRVS
jgi:hypothetical protein